MEPELILTVFFQECLGSKEYILLHVYSGLVPEWKFYIVYIGKEKKERKKKIEKEKTSKNKQKWDLFIYY